MCLVKAWFYSGGASNMVGDFTLTCCWIQFLLDECALEGDMPRGVWLLINRGRGKMQKIMEGCCEITVDFESDTHFLNLYEAGMEYQSSSNSAPKSWVGFCTWPMVVCPPMVLTCFGRCWVVQFTFGGNIFCCEHRVYRRAMEQNGSKLVKPSLAQFWSRLNCLSGGQRSVQELWDPGRLTKL